MRTSAGCASPSAAAATTATAALAGPVIHALDDAADLLRWYREFVPAQPDGLGIWYALLTVPPGPPFPEELHLRKVAAIVLTQVGDEESPALREARSFGKP